MVEIIGYKTVTVGEEIVEEPVYAEPIIVVGSGDKQIIMSVAEYEAEFANEKTVINEEDLILESNTIPS